MKPKIIYKTAMSIKDPKALIFSDVKADIIEPKTSAGRPTFFMAIEGWLSAHTVFTDPLTRLKILTPFAFAGANRPFLVNTKPIIIHIIILMVGANAVIHYECMSAR